MAKGITKQQLTHLTKQLRAALDLKVKIFRKTFPLYPVITFQRRIELIRTGMVGLKPKEEFEGKRDSYLTESFIFPDIVRDDEQEEKIQDYKANIEKELERILEKAIFVGAEEALKMLETFRK